MLVFYEKLFLKFKIYASFLAKIIFKILEIS